MIFSELYSAYYNAVAAILKAAIDHPLQGEELREIVRQHAFGESILQVEPALREGRWQLLRPDGTTPVRKEPSMPLTLLQKRWLKAISLDPRIRLFQEESLDLPGLSQVEPLFTPKDYVIFDRYLDGDAYEDETYQANFRLLVDAIHCQYPVSIEMESGKGKRVSTVLLPMYLEYSEKDDKFRLVALGRRSRVTVNLGRIRKCERSRKAYRFFSAKEVVMQEGAAWQNREMLQKEAARQPESVIFELEDRRNAMERVLLHFAHLQKQAERLSASRYRVTLCYDKEDETEILIRILSFGPMVKVVAPQHFVDLVKERLCRQKSWGH